VSGNENNDKFVIDPKTGVIRTNKVFDRDEPEREKEEYLTIRATDNGRPQLDTVCTIKITITDINDGVPLFERFVSYFPTFLVLCSLPFINLWGCWSLYKPLFYVNFPSCLRLKAYRFLKNKVMKGHNVGN